MIKGLPARLYYFAYDAEAGTLFSGDSEQHSVWYTADTELRQITVEVVELETTGVYTFELPAEYTDCDTAVCIVQSATEGVVIPPIELSFQEKPDTAAAAEILDAVSRLPALTAAEVAEHTLSSGITVGTALDQTAVKLAAYPAGDQIACRQDIPTAEEIASEILITDVSALSPKPYSVAVMVLGGMCSTMDEKTGIWTIQKPNGETVSERRFLTSDSMSPIVTVY